MSSGRSGHSTYYLDVSLVSQSQAGNYSIVNVHYYAIADSGWSGFASGIGFSATGYGNGTFGFDGTSAEIISYNYQVNHDANGYGSASFSVHSNDTGTQTFAGPMDLSQGIGLPRIPKPPGPVRNLTATAQGSSAHITFIGPADNGGSAIQSYTIQYSKDGGAYTGNVTNLNGDYTYVGLAPGSYTFRVTAKNAIGTGPAAQAGPVAIVGGGSIRVNNAWSPLNWQIRGTDSTWKPLTNSIREDNAWTAMK